MTTNENNFRSMPGPSPSVETQTVTPKESIKMEHGSGPSASALAANEIYQKASVINGEKVFVKHVAAIIDRHIAPKPVVTEQTIPCDICGGSSLTPGWMPSYGNPDNMNCDEPAEPCNCGNWEIIRKNNTQNAL